MIFPLKLTLKYQCAGIALVGLSLAVWDWTIARSFVLGCLVYAIPNAYFVFYAFRFSGVGKSQAIAQSFVRGESGKIALAVVGFVLVFRFVEVLHHPSVFFGFFSMIILQWYIAALVARRLEKVSDV